MLKKLPKRGTKVEDLVCIKCGKTLKECPLASVWMKIVQIK